MKLNLVILAILVLCFTACRTARLLQPATQVTTGHATKDSVSEVSIDSYTQADSASIIAEIGSDAQGNISLKNILDYSPGKNVTPQIRIKDNLVYVDCLVDSAEVYKKYSRFFTSTADTMSKVQIIPAGAIKAAASGIAGFFHRVLHVFGFIFLAQLIVLVVLFILKFKKIFTIF